MNREKMGLSARSLALSLVALGAWTVAVLMFCYVLIDVARALHFDRLETQDIFAIRPAKRRAEYDGRPQPQ